MKDAILLLLAIFCGSQPEMEFDSLNKHEFMEGLSQRFVFCNIVGLSSLFHLLLEHVPIDNTIHKISKRSDEVPGIRQIIFMIRVLNLWKTT